MGQVQRPAQAVGKGVEDPQAGTVKGHAGHGGRLVEREAHRSVAPVGALEGLEGQAGRAVSQGIGKSRCAGGGHGLHAVRQKIHARVSNELWRQRLQKHGIENGHVRPQGGIHQRVLDALVGENGEGRDLGAGAGGGGNGHKGHGHLRGHADGLGAVHGASAAQGDEQLRLEPPAHRRTSGRQRRRGIRGHAVKDLHPAPGKPGSHGLGHAVFREKPVGHQQRRLGGIPFEHVQGV